MKKVLLAGMLAAMTQVSMAQNQERQGWNFQNQNYGQQDTVKVEKSWQNYEFRKKGNWFAGVGAGAQYYIGDHNRQAKVMDIISPKVDVFVGRWFNDIFGARLEYTGIKCKGLTNPYGSTENPYSTGVTYEGKNGAPLQKQSYNYFNLHADFMFNMTQLIYGVDVVKRIDVIPYVGIGYGRVIDTPTNTTWTANLGLYNTCKLTKNLELALDIHAAVVKEEFDMDKGRRSGEGIVGATLGLNVRF